MIGLAVNGCCGRMGSRIMALAQADKEFRIVAGLEMKAHPRLGTVVNGIKVSDDLSAIEKADVIIDFTAVQATMNMLGAALKYKKALVIGTTGLNEQEIAAIERASRDIPILFSPNMSVGVNLLFKLVNEAAAKLKGYKVRIKEAHHIHKKDAPSGTAKKIAQIIESETGSCVDDIESVREGEIIGDHEVTFESDVDTVVLRHSAKTRDIFAKGSLQAAKWVAGRACGLFTMQDVIG
ncbi:MAG: 4-hydroxy-tetrahydrodipicolinate reductase [Candidatus Omnitrophica bacterium]|nr:4-hydroxy-tetrahydrodipicolinate reductase [Candidatus Omnitrophota bacterium]MBU4479124.1 4-hydroxy-tetrahydrodipicolinate reductase [Candidatus Omnitrophota bacterium]MCG2703391.1 4-hydroxy-tetrahydrodipicolinate reductase [Candidatus Omnitrophota bacterium]